MNYIKFVIFLLQTITVPESTLDWYR